VLAPVDQELPGEPATEYRFVVVAERIAVEASDQIFISDVGHPAELTL